MSQTVPQYLIHLKIKEGEGELQWDLQDWYWHHKVDQIKKQTLCKTKATFIRTFIVT